MQQGQFSSIKQFLRKHGFPQNLPDYSSSQYWNVRYNEEEDLSFEWYIQYPMLRHIILKHVPRREPVLQVGSGSSTVLEQMAQDDYTNLTGSDFARSLMMQKQEASAFLKDHRKVTEKKDINFQLLDITKRSKHPNGAFGAIIEKACLDCLSFESMTLAIKEIYRLLRPGGVLLSVSCLRPERRLKFMEGWKMAIFELPKQKIAQFAEVDKQDCYYVYVATKK